MAFLTLSNQLLTSLDGAGRANALACTAVKADVRIDAVYIAFVDCTCRALTLASSACYAYVGIDFVSHCSIFLIVVYSTCRIQKYGFKFE